MSELLLHHYDASPFSEKVRIVFGMKGLAWRSVLQPSVMPKPHLVPLTGGYRRIPVLQIGADVYCDSALVVRVLERLHPTPSLWPGGSEGVCEAVQWWADRPLFLATVPVIFGRIGDRVPQAFIDDRTKLMAGRVDFRELMASGPLAAEQLRAHAASLAAQLADDRPWLLGDTPSLADAAAYHPVWFLRSVPQTADVLAAFPRIEAWADRVKAIGHGARSECAPEEALRIARDAKPGAEWARDAGEPNGIAPGATVQVVPDDYGFDPVVGELVASDARELALRRSAPEVGEVMLHFPRAGYRVTRAG